LAALRIVPHPPGLTEPCCHDGGASLRQHRLKIPADGIGQALEIAERFGDLSKGGRVRIQPVNEVPDGSLRECLPDLKKHKHADDQHPGDDEYDFHHHALFLLLQ
jgi:hypothetical protein